MTSLTFPTLDIHTSKLHKLNASPLTFTTLNCFSDKPKPKAVTFVSSPLKQTKRLDSACVTQLQPRAATASTICRQKNQLSNGTTTFVPGGGVNASICWIASCILVLKMRCSLWHIS